MESLINVVEQSPSQITSKIDLTSLPVERLSELKVLVAAFNQSQRRIANDIFAASQQLTLIHEIVGHDNFFTFCHEEFGIKERTARRYLNTYRVLTTHISDNGRIDIVEARNFTQAALLLLNDDTNEDVISEIRSIAQGGGKVDEATVRRLLEEKSSQYESQLSLANAEAETAKRELKRISEQSELSVLRLQSQISSQAEVARRAQEHAADLEEENRRLASQPTIVTEVPAVPPEYKSIEDAIADAKMKHASAIKDLSSTKAALAELQQQHKQAKDSFAVLEATSADVNAFKDAIEQAFLKMPASRLAALAKVDAGVAAQLAAMGDELILRGQMLRDLNSKSNS